MTLTEASVPAFERIVGRLGSMDRAEPPGCPLSIAESPLDLSKELISRGIITTDIARAKRAVESTPAYPVRYGLEHLPQVHVSIGPGDLLRAGTATLAALFRVRTTSLEGIVKHFACAKPQTPRPADLSAEKMAMLVRPYLAMRPLFYSAKAKCLFDSLALLIYLRRLRFRPAWVFGVSTAPFLAHCWLQFGDTVLNDTAEHASRFTPIMIV